MGKVKKYFPLVLLEVYLGGIYLLYRCGIWFYPYRKDWLTALFILGCMTAMGLGYVLCAKKMKVVEGIRQGSQRRWSIILIASSALLLIPCCYGRTGEIYPHLIEAFGDLAQAYAKASEAVFNTGIAHYFSAFATFFFYLLYIDLFFFWKDMKNYRWFGVAEIVWYVAVEMSTGHNKGIIFFALITVIIFVCSMMNNGTKREKLFRTLIMIFVTLVGVSYFTISVRDRNRSSIASLEASGMSIKEMELEAAGEMIIDEYGYEEPLIVEKEENNEERFNEYKVQVILGQYDISIVNRYEEAAKTLLEINPKYIDEYSYSFVNSDDAIYKMMPSMLRDVYVMGNYYLTHGFHSLALALRLPFESSFGFSTHYYFEKSASKLLSVDFYKRSYVYKVNQAGYPVSTKWGTAYLQWASDLSFPGVVLFMGILGAFICRLWWDVQCKNDYLSIVVLTFMTVNLLFISSWWQAGRSGTDFLMLYGPLIFWIVRELRDKWKRGLERKKAIGNIKNDDI